MIGMPAHNLGTLPLAPLPEPTAACLLLIGLPHVRDELLSFFAAHDISRGEVVVRHGDVDWAVCDGDGYPRVARNSIVALSGEFDANVVLTAADLSAEGIADFQVSDELSIDENRTRRAKGVGFPAGQDLDRCARRDDVKLTSLGGLGEHRGKAGNRESGFHSWVAPFSSAAILASSCAQHGLNSFPSAPGAVLHGPVFSVNVPRSFVCGAVVGGKQRTEERARESVEVTP